jgi:hypothetical protein
MAPNAVLARYYDTAGYSSARFRYCRDLGGMPDWMIRRFFADICPALV